MKTTAKVLALAAAIVGTLTASVVDLSVRSGPSNPPAVTIGAVTGPSAERLAHGKWITIPKPPFRLCDPVTAEAGPDIYVIDFGLNQCPIGAARYDAATNEWRSLPSPPAPLGNAPAVAWAGDRLIAVRAETGATFAYTPSTRRWQTIGSIPRAGGTTQRWFELLWTGSTLLANGMYIGGIDTYVLDAEGKWSRIAHITENTGAFVDASMAAYRNSVFAWVATSAGDGKQAPGPTRLLRLDGRSWQQVPPTVTTLQSQLNLTAITGGILVTGSLCQLPGMCSFEDAAAAIVRPETDSRPITLKPPYETPYPYDIAAGATAIVVTYPAGSDSLGRLMLRDEGPQPGTTVIYDVPGHTWLAGPRAPTNRRGYVQAFWTSAGVVLLSTIGTVGWLLQPYPSAL